MQDQPDIYRLPPDLPVPTDDGEADHLPGMTIPALPMPTTSGAQIDLSEIPGRTVLYCYPRTGLPDRDPPQGWDEIPGARGCTPQSCAFRDHYSDLQALGAQVFGMSTQTTEYQREVVERLHLPYDLLSDSDLTYAMALQLPTFEFEGQTLLKRITMILRDGVIEHVFYPVFPPDRNATDVIAWLKVNPPERGPAK
jgi:peroxiredoxin